MNRTKSEKKQENACRYSIGLLSRMFGVTPGSIRYYEDEGIFLSQRGPDSSIRRYSARMIKLLFSVRRFLSLGFQVEEIQQIYAAENLPQIQGLLVDKAQALRREMEAMQAKLDALEGFRHRLDLAQERLWTCELTQSPPLWVIVNQKGQQVDESAALSQQIGAFMRRLPQVFPTVIRPKECLTGGQPGALARERLCGFGCFSGEGGVQGDFHRYFPSTLCVHTFVRMDDATQRYEALFAHCLDYIRANRLEMAQDAYGIDLVRTGEGACLSGNCREGRPQAVYYEYWIPVRAPRDQSPMAPQGPGEGITPSMP